MSFDADDEILQDFLVEAAEIVEQLGEQLVDLEHQPDDMDLLNAIFRGFHTIKGGAGFLSNEPLVEICHRAEDVFNLLRQGERKVTPDLMDPILEALDVVNAAMEYLRNGEMPEPADAELLARLERYAVPGDEAPEPVVEAQPEPVPRPAPQADATATSRPQAATSPEEITEEEFEVLLDELHGPGRFDPSRAAAAPAPQAPQGDDAAAAVVGGGDEITEEEFEALLDQLHGPGRFDPDKAVTSEARAADAQAPGQAAPAPSPAREKPAVSTEAEPKAAKQAAPAKEEPKPEQSVAPAEPKAKPQKAAARAPASEKPAAPKKVAKPPARPSGETSVRVDTQRLDEIMNMVGELVLVRNRLSLLKTSMADEELSNVIGNLDVVTSDLQLAVMKTRMQPIKKVFGRFPRVVRDLARSLKKEVDLEMRGEDTDLDKNLVEALADPMVHLVRNAVDHGIEMPDEREAAGKPRRGKVVLSAEQEGDHILLCIEDDGKGMDAEVLRRKAVEKGIMDAESAARLDEKECYNLIFHAGFSTKEEISDASGRGVGMDVVKTKIAQINGTVEIDSEKGKGSKITIKLPLTLAILPTLMVVLGQQPFALPLGSVVEIFNLDLSRTHTVDGQMTIQVRGRALPLFYLSNWLVNNGAMQGQPADNGHVVVVNVGGVQVGLVVDFLIGQEEVVIKPLGALLQGLEGMAGATITSDGKIALILDVPGLMRKYARRY
ncbi:chemotaxis protein CheA [endosymbiont of unidentified scaly snail isolate Monju]|uniref:chemotaxis protein CheA n=1 Tax=endosymbiont of unidentified scaly snail isolate Monju TaxID=1248727 RepID=UPI00038929C5|nr:chemotaxis protein CheA [endosymbiont of unidentified scaly snail isolate Monju]BAN69597.1 two-component system, chemotaxis family, sensor kinase CheA [endosymbiont of unidentified scaly snail isolate Monju]